jgi:hypothetical protein
MRYGLKPRAIVLEGDKGLIPCPADHAFLPHEIGILGEDGDIRHAHWPCELWRVGFRVPALESAPDLTGPLPASLQHEIGIIMVHLCLPCASSGARLRRTMLACTAAAPGAGETLWTVGFAFTSSRAGRCPRSQHHGRAARPLSFWCTPGRWPLRFSLPHDLSQGTTTIYHASQVSLQS